MCNTATTTIPSDAPAISTIEKRSLLTRFLKRKTTISTTTKKAFASNITNKKAGSTLNDGWSDHTANTEEASSEDFSCGELDHEDDAVYFRLEPPTVQQSLVLDNRQSSTGQQRSHGGGAHIRFSSPSIDDNRTILGRHEYSTSELDACWFRGDEYATITRSCCKQIKKLEAGENLRDQKFCSRGLESHTRLAALAKTQSRRNAWDAVLNEQHEQLSLGVADDEPIAQKYQGAAASSLMWAQRVGLQDQKAAALVYDDLLDEFDLVNSSF